MGNIKNQIANYYNNKYRTKFKEYASSLDTVEAERKAQKFAIKNTALHFFEEPEGVDKKEIWKYIYAAHVHRKSGVDIEPETISKVISADQSWKKSGGHAFEEMVKSICNKNLEETGISVLLQKELSIKLRNGELKNRHRDLEWLKTQTATSAFDLFIIYNASVFGCLQAKTSIRDRVTRDREPSRKAMDKFFWSIAFVLDGAFLRLPKFNGMVNGGTRNYSSNGWHAMYAFSLPTDAGVGRIFRLEDSLEPFISNAGAALDQWTNQRQWLNSEWSPD